ncbi:GtrA family protein [Streptomyces iconiensis]|uniref:GtrA family protein n=1 Tax=Streptomyces iconiensis TaxID=1384038 RepID=A0ABT7A2A8_9ACTN|nr:GtrA family protein [Streptomyces iconiensis]MDJ1134981.1 GtrA family protein [Streptomyces iconiensis]
MTLTRQVVSFSVIGVCSGALTLVIYVMARDWWSPVVANLVALTAATLFNTEANRRLTFGTPRRRGLAHVQSAVLFAAHYALTSCALLGLGVLVPAPSRTLELTVLLTATLVGTVGRFLLLRGWVFKKAA